MNEIQRCGIDGALDHRGVFVTHADHEQAVKAAIVERDSEWHNLIEAKAIEYEEHAKNHGDTAAKFLDKDDDYAARVAFGLESDCIYIADLLRTLISTGPGKGSEEA